MPRTIPGTTRFAATSLLAAAVFVAGLPLAAEEAGDEMTLGSLIPTDAIRIEVAPGSLNECAPLMSWAFNLPSESAGFGPFLPGVPVGYGPTCAVIPQTAPASYSLTGTE